MIARRSLLATAVPTALLILVSQQAPPSTTGPMATSTASTEGKLGERREYAPALVLQTTPVPTAKGMAIHSRSQTQPVCTPQSVVGPTVKL